MKGSSRLIQQSFLWLTGLLFFGGVSTASPAGGHRLDSAAIEKATGATGVWNEEEGVFKVSVPRTDLSVAAAGVHLTPALGLTTWAAFQSAGDQTMVMGDLVLTEAQVGPVMDTALASGLEVTALHNHFALDSPKVMFMHIGGLGEEVTLAEAVGKVLAKIKEQSERRPPPGGRVDPATTSLQAERIASILGRKGQLKDGVYKIVIGRKTTMHGHSVGNAMGVNTWAAFAGSDDRAVVDGDFAVLASELQAVLKALRTADIQVVAIHNHMVGEEPRIVFLHFWGVGDVARLANGVRAALSETP